jgi:uncharacterized protein with HEPN domain
MKNINRSQARIEHISIAIQQIESFTEGLNETEFSNNLIVQSAVLYQFTIIGEAILHIDAELLEKVNYPWHMVRGFRNFIAHEDHKLEMSAVWTIISIDLQTLKNKVAELQSLSTQ